jgi:hypothetical protein
MNTPQSCTKLFPLLFITGIMLLTGLQAFAEVPPLSPAPAALGGSEPGVNGVVALVDNYLHALTRQDWDKAYELLSSESKQAVTKAQWIAGGKNAPAIPASAVNLIMDLLPPGAEECQITDLTIAGTQAKISFRATYTFPFEIALVWEKNQWKVHLPSTDRTCIYSLARSISQTVTDKSASSASPGAPILLAPYVVSHRVDKVDLEIDKAAVKVAETAVVSVSLELRRQGPYWEIVTGALSTSASPAPSSSDKPGAATEPPKPGNVKWLPGPRHWRK